MAKVQRFIRFIVCCSIRSYQLFLSPLLGANCRFFPTCSHYAMEAIERHGLRRGAILTLGRLSRCHPWGSTWGFDPVPKESAAKTPNQKPTPDSVETQKPSTSIRHYTGPDV